MATLRENFEEIRGLAPQPRGKAFEGFLGEVFATARLRHRLAYRPTGEEIDGAIWWQQRTLLLEAKWMADPLPASAIYAFKGKVDGKFDGTLGVFISMSGYSKDCIDALSHGKSLNILLFDSNDVEAIADDIPIIDVLEEKLFAAGQTGNVYMPWKELSEARALIDSSKQKSAAKLLVVICEGPSDEVVLRSLIAHAARRKAKSVSPKFLVSYGKHPLMTSLLPSLAGLLSNGIDGPAAVLTVFDADTESGSGAEEQRRKVLKNLEDLPASWRVHVGVAVPEIEHWIGIDRRLRGAELAIHLQTLDWDEQVNRNPELASLLGFIESVI